MMVRVWMAAAPWSAKSPRRLSVGFQSVAAGVVTRGGTINEPTRVEIPKTSNPTSSIRGGGNSQVSWPFVFTTAMTAKMQTPVASARTMIWSVRQVARSCEGHRLLLASN